MKEDEKISFHERVMEFDKILLNEKDKYIQKMHKALLKIKMEDKTVNEKMIQWAKNFRYNTEMSEWDKIWTANIKITKATNMKKNLYKMFYRWYLPPEKLSKMYLFLINVRSARLK